MRADMHKKFDPATADVAELYRKYEKAAAEWGKAMALYPGNTRSYTRRMNMARDAYERAYQAQRGNVVSA
jgi:hypothetical protein